VRNRWFRTVNLLDTPGHEDFSEDTYRTLTAVDSVLMIIDGAKGVEDRTVKFDGCVSFYEIRQFDFLLTKWTAIFVIQLICWMKWRPVLKIVAAPITWPIGMSHFFKGVYNLYTDTIHVFVRGRGPYLDGRYSY